MIAPNGLIVGLTASNDVVVPVYADYAVWSEPAQAFFDAVDQSLPADRQFNRKIFWLSGTVSPRVKQQVTRRGWEIEDGISEQYLVKSTRRCGSPGSRQKTASSPKSAHSWLLGGPATGPAAEAFIRRETERVFAHWATAPA